MVVSESGGRLSGAKSVVPVRSVCDCGRTGPLTGQCWPRHRCQDQGDLVQVPTQCQQAEWTGQTHSLVQLYSYTYNAWTGH